jgi:DNA repair exonuclease SbcCD ATPase subunit
MEQKRIIFPDDQDNRIQKLYYDINIHTIFNRTKLQNVQNKFYKYKKFVLNKFYEIQPKLLELQKIRDGLYVQWRNEAKRISLMNDPTPENKEKRKALVPIFRKADEEYEEIRIEEYYYDRAICYIQDKITEIKTHQKVIKRYKKCENCEKMDMPTISGCKSEHKICSECVYDKTECPVCNEDLDLQYCAICMENKKEIVETGCENKHQICKECLDKIIRKNNLCPFCRDYCSKKPVDPHPDSYYLMDNGEDIRDLWQDRADDRRDGRGW